MRVGPKHVVMHSCEGCDLHKVTPGEHRMRECIHLDAPHVESYGSLISGGIGWIGFSNFDWTPTWCPYIGVEHSTADESEFQELQNHISVLESDIHELRAAQEPKE